MAHQVEDIEIHEGNDVAIPITIKDEAGDAIDITGFVLKFEWSRGRIEKFSKTPEGQKSSVTSSEITIDVGTGGTLTVFLDAVDTAGKAGDYYFECQATDTTSKKSTTVNGNLDVPPSLII